MITNKTIDGGSVKTALSKKIEKERNMQLYIFNYFILSTHECVIQLNFIGIELI